MTKGRFFSLLLALSCCCLAPAGGTFKEFFHLTGDELAIDSLLPVFSLSVPLGGGWADSTYEARIEYPEFEWMTQAECARYLEIAGEEPPGMPVVTSRTVVERKRGSLEVSFVPLAMRDGRMAKLTGFMLRVTSSGPSSGARRRAASPAARYAEHSVLAEGSWAKIRVPSTGLYDLSDAFVRSCGFQDPSTVRLYGYGGALQNETLVAEELAELDDLKEVPTCRVGGSRLFHGQGPVSWETNTVAKRTRNPYSDYGYYFLTDCGGDEPLYVDEGEFLDSFYPSPDDYHTLHEVDNYSWYQGGRNLFEDSPIQVDQSRDYQLDVDSNWEGIGSLAIGLTAGQASTAQVLFNDSVVGTVRISITTYDNGNETENSYRVYGVRQSNTVTIAPLTGGPVRLDYVSLCLPNAKDAPSLEEAYPTPEYVYRITNQDHHADGFVDMVIIVPTSGKLLEQAERMKAMHEEHDSMTVRIVPADELFNEFSSGTPDANAYRRYLKMLYDRAETEEQMPSYLFLFGDCLWDNRMNTAECSGLDPDDFLLCFESENSFSSTNCYVDDGFFTNLDDGEGGSPTTDKGDVAVGRFPVRDASEAKIMTDKTLAYVENANAGSWQNVMMFLGDDGNENQHMEHADEMASLAEEMIPSMYVKRVMWDAYNVETTSTGNTYPDVTKIIKQQQEEGALIMNYSGHGRADQMSHENVLRVTDFEEFTNENLPLWITASCDIMPFDSQQSNIGEAAVLNAKGGAVAFYGTTRTVYVDRNLYINREFLRALFTQSGGRYTSLGEAQRVAKNSLISSGTDVTLNKLQYTLLGDPALVLNFPRHGAVIDRINGTEVPSSRPPSLRAGSVVTLEGHIEGLDAQVDSTFNGTATVLVRDAEHEVVCKLNDDSADGASTPFRFYDRDGILYNGSDNVADGRFTFSFAVPMDIDYTNDTGLINVFAVNPDTRETVNGYNEDFTVGGTANVANDSIGPSIYCYLNTTSFTNGGKVNSTPYFVAQVMDNDGINASGSGIGHDMTLIVDGDANYTFNLNGNFQYEFGSYTRGSTFYSIPELEEGMHSLKFRAWDILNNPSTAELTFQVVKGLGLDYLSIGVTDNPATTSTTFIINHDREGSELDVLIDVYDASGRPLWHHSETGVSPMGGAYTVEWDLRGNNGRRLDRGIYLYRVRVGCDGSRKESRAKKLIVL